MSRCLLAIVVAGALAAADARAENVVIHHQGRLLSSDDTPVSGLVSLEAALYGVQAGGGEPIWTAQYTVPVMDGLYTLALGEVVDGVGTPLDVTHLAGPRWLELTVNGARLKPRLRIGHVPQAAFARTAAFLGDHPAEAYLRGVTTGDGLKGAGTSDDPLTADLPALDAVVGEVGDARDGHDTLSARLSAMDEALAGGGAAQAEITAARGGAATLKARLDTMVSDASATKAEVTAARGGSANLKARLDGMVSDASATKAEVTAARGGSANLKARLDAMASSTGAVRAELEEARGGAGSLGERLDELDSGVPGLPWSHRTHSVTISDSNPDLGDSIAPLLAKYKSVNVNLARDLVFRWNKPITLQPFQRLTVSGLGYTNGAKDIGVTILMDQNRSWLYDGIEHRDVRRVIVGSHAYFALYGVNLVESSEDDPRPIGRSSGMAGLVSISGDFGTARLSQIHVKTTEHLVNIAERTYARVHFGHTFVEKYDPKAQDILMVTDYHGHSFGGNGAVVSHSHTHPGDGVSIGCSAAILCLK